MLELGAGKPPESKNHTHCTCQYLYSQYALWGRGNTHIGRKQVLEADSLGLTPALSPTTTLWHYMGLLCTSAFKYAKKGVYCK